ncbi:MAG: hypothetical protein AAGH64_11190, partial [Planctomycetota bacterium]
APEGLIGEEFEDATLITDGASGATEFALAGLRFFGQSFFRQDGFLAVTDVAGEPLRAWSLGFEGSALVVASAIRQSAVESDLLVLATTAQTTPGDLREAVVLRIDELTGTPAYALRYTASPDDNRWGMEVEGDEAVFAGAVRVEEGSDREGLYVLFDQVSGLPIAHTRYQPFASDQSDLRFNDVALFPGEGAVFATGAIEVMGKDGSQQGSKLVIARLDPGGGVGWIRAYNTFVDGEEFRDARGWSIAVTEDGNVAAVARSSGDAGDGALAVLVEPGAGAPLASNLIQGPGALRPAYASLDLQEGGRLIVSGTVAIAGETERAVMWGMDPSSLSVDWFFIDDTGASVGNDAIVQPGEGLVLAGATVPFDVPVFANEVDALLVRTDREGAGPCGLDDPPGERETTLEPIDVPVEVIQMPPPRPAEPEINAVEQRFDETCERANDCLGDFDGDGDVDLGDFGVFGAAFNSMLGDANYNPAADFDMDGDVDLGDFGVFGAEFNRTDCL